MSLPEVALDVESILSLDPVDDPLSLDWPKRYIARELGWIPTFDLDRTDPHGLYGGQVIAQTVWAACQTVPDGFDVHSTHGYFLRPGNSQERIVYNVHEVRTGRGYATRRIEAIQFDKVIHTSFANFKAGFASQVAEQDEAIKHGTPYPKDSWYPKYSEISALPGIPDVDIPQLHEFKSHWPMPIQYRKLPMSERTNAALLDVPDRRQVHFFRSRYEISNRTHNFMAVVLMYSSDRNFLFTATNAHLATHDLSYGHVASLDHSMIIHTSLGKSTDAKSMAEALFTTNRTAKPRRVRDHDSNRPAGDEDSNHEDWFTYDTHSPASGNSRCLVVGKMWNRQGQHLATVMQEALSDVTVIGPRKDLADSSSTFISKEQTRDSRHKDNRRDRKGDSKM